MFKRWKTAVTLGVLAFVIGFGVRKIRQSEPTGCLTGCPNGMCTEMKKAPKDGNPTCPPGRHCTMCNMPGCC